MMDLIDIWSDTNIRIGDINMFHGVNEYFLDFHDNFKFQSHSMQEIVDVLVKELKSRNMRRFRLHMRYNIYDKVDENIIADKVIGFYKDQEIQIPVDDIYITEKKMYVRFNIYIEIEKNQ